MPFLSNFLVITKFNFRSPFSKAWCGGMTHANEIGYCTVGACVYPLNPQAVAITKHLITHSWTNLSQPTEPSISKAITLLDNLWQIMNHWECLCRFSRNSFI